MADYQLIVIGAGPGGYTAALRAANPELSILARGHSDTEVRHLLDHGADAAVMAVAFVCLRSVDSPEGALQVLAILAGAVAAMMVACGDRATEILHRL